MNPGVAVDTTQVGPLVSKKVLEKEGRDDHSAADPFHHHVCRTYNKKERRVLEIGFKFLVESYISHVELNRPKMVKVVGDHLHKLSPVP
ncbi:hypothetical protein LINPERHAP1_LOCUS24058, partial [Linum perenne]